MTIDIGIHKTRKSLMFRLEGIPGCEPMVMEKPVREGEAYGPHVRSVLESVKRFADKNGEKFVNPVTGVDWTIDDFLAELRGKFLADGRIWEAS